MGSAGTGRKRLRSLQSEGLQAVAVAIAMVVTIAGSILGFMGVLSPDLSRPSYSATPIPPSDLAAVQTELGGIRAELDGLSSKVSSLEQGVGALSHIPPAAALNSELQQIRGDLDSLDGKVGRIEEVILDDPVKALSLLLLENEVESLRQKYEADLQVVRDEIGRVYSQSNWFIGLMFTMAIGLLTLAISNFLPRRGRDHREDGREG